MDDQYTKLVRKKYGYPKRLDSVPRNAWSRKRKQIEQRAARRAAKRGAKQVLDRRRVNEL